MIRLRKLKTGDQVALVAPASSCAAEEIDAGVAELARIGLRAVYDQTIFDKRRFTAGSKEVRAKAINAAFANPEIAGLIAIRGGYGSAHLLPLLDNNLLRTARKPLIGYSDITALLNLYARNGLTAIHGPMIDRRFSKGASAYHEDSFRRVVMTPAPAGEMCPEGLEALHPGAATGVLVGGTVTQLMASLGTPWAFEPPSQCVLFLEDVNERPFRIDRMLVQASQAGIFQRANAIVFGEFPGCDEPGGNPAIKDVLRDFTRGFRGPVLFGFPSGHTTAATWTLPFGVTVQVTGDGVAGLRILESAVE